MIEFFVTHWHPTPLNKMKGHWTTIAAKKKRDRNRIALEKMRLRLPDVDYKARLHLHIVLGNGQRACDPDAYWKSLNDALVHAKLLRDDSHKWLELAPVEYSRDRHTWGSRITIIPIE